MSQKNNLIMIISSHNILCRMIFGKEEFVKIKMADFLLASTYCMSLGIFTFRKWLKPVLNLDWCLPNLRCSPQTDRLRGAVVDIIDW